MEIVNQWFISIISISGIVVILLIAILVGIKSIIDAILALGLNIPFFSRKFREREVHNIKTILSEFTKNVPSLLKFLRSEEIAYRVPPGDTESQLKELVRKYTKFIGGKEVGPVTKTNLNYYVGFRDTIGNIDDDSLLAYILASWIRTEIQRIQGIDFDKIAVPSLGHISLAFYVAQVLNTPCVSIVPFVHSLGEPSIHGLINEGDNFILLDDSSTSGKTLGECVRTLKSKGGLIEHAFVVMQRTDRKLINETIPEEYLATMGVTLHSLKNWSDRDIAEILK